MPGLRREESRRGACATPNGIIEIMRGALFFAAALILPIFGQSSLTFEVASVRPAPPPAPGARVYFGPPRGGPGTSDPGQITWTNAALRNILMTAYEAQTFQVI